MRFVRGNALRDVEPVKHEVIRITGRNDMGLLDYVITRNDVENTISVTVYVDKKNETDNFFSDAQQGKSLAYYRGGKATRLTCDILREALALQSADVDNSIANISFMMYLFEQVNFVCKENIEDVLGVTSLKGSEELLKEIRENKKQEYSQYNNWL